MFASSFFVPKTTSPFTHCKSFYSIQYFLNALREKEKELRIADEANADKHALECQKYRIISGLVESVDKEIALFNRETINNIANTLGNELDLSSKLLTNCVQTLNYYYPVLAEPRNDKRQQVNEKMQWGAAGLAVFSVAALPVSLVTGALVVGGVVITTKIMGYLTGLNDSRAYSAYLLIELIRQLITITQGLEKKQIANALTLFRLDQPVSFTDVHARYQTLILHYPDQSDYDDEFAELNNAYKILINHIKKQEEIEVKISCANRFC